MPLPYEIGRRVAAVETGRGVVEPDVVDGRRIVEGRHPVDVAGTGLDHGMVIGCGGLDNVGSGDTTCRTDCRG